MGSDTHCWQPVVQAVSRGGGRDFTVLQAALPPRAQESLQLQETMEGIREENLQPCPGPLQRTRLPGVEPVGSGQANGLGRAAGGPDGASQGGARATPSQDKAGHDSNSHSLLKGKILKRCPTWAQSSTAAQARQLCPLPFRGCPALLCCLIQSNSFTSLLL